MSMSGGIDSEFVLKLYKLKIPFRAVSLRLFDGKMTMTCCMQLNIAEIETLI